MTEIEITTFRKAAYECYRLEWMLAHGKSLTELFDILKDLWLEAGTDESASGPEALLGSFEQNSGFSGELWACFDEFLDTEYRDPGYMAHLLSGLPHMKKKWEEDTGLTIPVPDTVTQPATTDNASRGTLWRVLFDRIGKQPLSFTNKHPVHAEINGQKIELKLVYDTSGHPYLVPANQ